MTYNKSGGMTSLATSLGSDKNALANSSSSTAEGDTDTNNVTTSQTEIPSDSSPHNPTPSSELPSGITGTESSTNVTATHSSSSGVDTPSTPSFPITTNSSVVEPSVPTYDTATTTHSTSSPLSSTTIATPTTSSSSTAALVVIPIIGLLIVCGAVVVYIFIRRRKKRLPSGSSPRNPKTKPSPENGLIGATEIRLQTKSGSTNSISQSTGLGQPASSLPPTFEQSKKSPLNPDGQAQNPPNCDLDPDGSTEDFIDNIKRHCENLMQYQKEYDSLPESSVKTSSIARTQENIVKNRYVNILPFDENRVILPKKTEDESDYVNASYIDGAKKKKVPTATLR